AWQRDLGKDNLTPWAVAVSPAGDRLAITSGPEMPVLDARSGAVRLTCRGHTSGLLGVCWSPGGNRLASASFDCTARVWEAATGRCLLPLQGHTRDVNAVAWSPDGARLATASDDGTARAWDAVGGTCLLTLRVEGNVGSVCWSPDSRLLATGENMGE